MGVNHSSISYKLKEDLNIMHEFDYRDIIHAIENNSPVLLQRMVDEGYDVSRNLFDYGGTALHFAAMSNKFDIMQPLLRARIDVNAENVAGATPVLLAIADLKCIKLLLEHDANINETDEEGR